MAWYEIALLILAAGLLVPVFIIFIRHFPQIALIEVAKLPEEKQQQVKVIMAEQRLYRKFRRFNHVIGQFIKPISAIVAAIAKQLRERLVALEQKYKLESLQVKSATESGKESMKQKIALELKQARDAASRDEFEKAEAHFLQVVQLDPLSIDAFEGLGDIYAAQKKYDEAREVFMYLLKLIQDQEAAEVHLTALPDNDKPEEQQQLVAVEQAKIHHALSHIYRQQSQLDKAITQLDKALKIESANPKYLDALLDICIMKKDKIRAQEVFFKLKEVNADNKKLVSWEKEIASI